MIDQQTRQLALRGDYIPQEGEACYYILNGYNGVLTRNDDGWFADRKRNGAVFFPDEQTRTEFLQVGVDWVPKKGDTYWEVSGSNLYGPFVQNDIWDGTNMDGHWFFPSEEQRSAFIAKRKGEELRPAHDFTVLMGGGDATSEQTRKLTPDELTRKANVPKPQTITICISDEAMVKIADRINLLVQEDWTAKYSRSVVEAVVSGLYLEATLNS